MFYRIFHCRTSINKWHASLTSVDELFLTKSLCLTCILTYWGHGKRQLTRYIQHYFRTFVTCALEINIWTYTSHTYFMWYNFSFKDSLIPFVLSFPVNFSSLPAVQFKLSFFSCFFSIASNSSLYNSALNCAITEFGIFWKQEINSFSRQVSLWWTFVKCYILWCHKVPLE